jgi:glycosyltransferase involved in cell wall biosynthesis
LSVTAIGWFQRRDQSAGRFFARRLPGLPDRPFLKRVRSGCFLGNRSRPPLLWWCCYSLSLLCYSWADVVLIVSRWEGLPLTLLGAMRHGAVVCATVVGAVAEAVTHNKTGFLLPAAGTGTIAREAVHILQRLSTDRDLLRRISSAAAQAAKEWTLENSAQGFLRQLDRLAAS